MGFDFNNNTPIYFQIAEILKIKIISGELAPGERLPSVRDLSVDLKANPNTVQRALGDLESEGLIFTERTNGKFITGDTALIDGYKSKYADSLARQYMESMQKIGFDKNGAIERLQNTGGNNQWKK